MNYDALSAPAANAFAVTPSDSAAIRAISLYVGGAGDVTVVTEAGDTVTFSAVPVGVTLPVRVRKVMATGTTATLITAYSDR